MGGTDQGERRPPRLRPALLALAVLLGVLGPAPSPGLAQPVGPYPDVPAGHPFAAHIAWSADRGLVQGYADGTFRPGAPLTRQAMAAMLHRLATLEGPVAVPATGPPDVPANHTFATPIRWAAAEGVIPVAADGRFHPTGTATRRQLAVALHRLAGAPTPRADAAGYPDVASTHPDHDAIVVARWARLLVGYGDGTFRSEAPLTRQAMAAALRRWAVRPPDVGPLALRPLQTGDDLRIVDDLGRDVLLRGVNVTSLGEYWQGDPALPTTLPTTEADWDAMAARGFSVVRLVVHWSRLEPVRGQFDEAYLDEVDAYVRAAAAHGMYTVIDMHQDAYSASIATEDAAECPPGTTPHKGWDGAPAWAVITDGLSTCETGGDRNSAPAVHAAWNHFYDDTDGIRGRFVATWAHVARRFAGRPEVAGYNLLNEPEVSRPAAELDPIYQQFTGDTVRAVRAAEAEAGADFEHLLFVEPAIPAGNPTFGIVVPDPAKAGVPARNVVAAPHNYAESIGSLPLTIEQMNQLFLGIAADLGVPTWIGEHGFWDTSPTTLAKLDRYAADEDRHRIGGAWWQWRQPCGDPHSIPWGGRPEGVEWQEVHLNTLSCPDDTVGAPTEALLRVVGRGFPRATPGRLALLESDAHTGRLVVEGTAADPGGTLEVWTPSDGTAHELVTEGLTEVAEHPVPGGRLVTARVGDTGAYALRVVPVG